MKSKSTPMPPKPSRPSKKPSAAVSRSLVPSKPITDGPQPWEPEPYQIEAAKFMVSKSAAGLFLDPGLRKTSIVLAVLRTLMKKGLVNKTLVVAPPRVCMGTWPEEVAKWADFNHLRVVVLHGLKKEELLNVDADIYLVSYPSLDWIFRAHKTKNGKGKIKVSLDYSWIDQLGVNCLVCDELSKARNTNSLTFKILSEARDHFDYIYGMTGSPAPRSLENLFGLMKIIDGGYSLGAYITHYRNAYFMPSGYGGFDYKLQPEAEKRIYKAIAPFVFRLDAKDYIKLPQLIENTVWVDLPPAARKVYDEMEKDMFAEIEEAEEAGIFISIFAVNRGVSSGKCRQIANGGLYKDVVVNDDGTLQAGPREWFELHQEKALACLDMVEELDGAPAMIVYDFHHDLERLLKVFGKDTPRIGSGVSMKTGAQTVKDWNAGKIPVLLVHPASMSHGLNMQAGGAQHILWHSQTWDYEAKDQLIRRLLRSGNTASHVFSHTFAAKDTVDVLMLRSSAKKAVTQKELNDAMAAYTLARRPKLRKR